MMGAPRGIVTLLGVAACGFHPAAKSQGSPGDAASDTLPDAAPNPLACPAIPDDPSAITVASTTELVAALASAQTGQTIALAPGTYALAGTLAIATDGVTLRSTTNDATSVTLDAGAQAGTAIAIRASGVSLISLTLAHSGGIALEIQPTIAGDLTGVRVYDVTFLDNVAEQIRIDPSNIGGPYADTGEIGCSRFVKTSVPACPGGTIGIYASGTRGWRVHDNQFSDDVCTGFERAMWFRGGSRDTQVIANRFLNSNMNITLGDDPSTPDARTYADAVPATCSGLAGPPQHWGGLVCNNAIAGLGVPPQTSGDTFDDGLSLWGTCETWVLHNTVVSPADPLTFHDIEFRFAGTYVHLVNNLVEQAPVSRDGGMQDAAFATSNVTYAATTDFADATDGDLHLAAAAPEGSGASIAGIGLCESDADGVARVLGAPRVGAYEK